MSLLQWDDLEGYGFYPATGDVYDNGYFDSYVEYAKTPRAKAVNEARIALVNKYAATHDIIDVGIGCGLFIETRDEDVGPKTFGYDINPKAMQWLLDRHLWRDPYQGHAYGVTLWDTLECMRYPKNLLRCLMGLVFISMPIFRDKKHALSSKYMKPNEPYHFFTHQGLVRWMTAMGFQLFEQSDMEEKLGCEDIKTFVFRRLR
jgi:hypothetical protein